MRSIYYGVIGAGLLLLTQALAETVPTAMPGLAPFPAAVRQQLDRALQAKGDAYTPHTKPVSYTHLTLPTKRIV